MPYSNAEYFNMLMCLGRSECNYAAARRDYEERFSRIQGLQVPSERTFQRLHHRVYSTGSVQDNLDRSNGGRPHNNEGIEEEVLRLFTADPTQSTRDVARELGTNNARVWRILHEDGQHPFRYRRVQALLPSDYVPRTQFCNWLVDKVEEDATFLEHVLFTDECSFRRTGVFNSHNEHVWALENPHAIKESHFQHRWRINVWAGILGDRVIGPYFLNQTMNGTNYLLFLREVFGRELDTLPLSFHRSLWFQHDGAPPHFLRTVRDYLDAQFPGKWIGRGGPISWPPRSPDLTPLDFFLWGHVKQIVYKKTCENEEEMRARIITAFHMIAPTVLRSVRENIIKRCRKCRDVGGRHVEYDRRSLRQVDVFIN